MEQKYSVTEALEELSIAKTEKRGSVDIRLALALSAFIAQQKRDNERQAENVKGLFNKMEDMYAIMDNLSNSPYYREFPEELRRKIFIHLKDWDENLKW